MYNMQITSDNDAHITLLFGHFQCCGTSFLPFTMICCCNDCLSAVSFASKDRSKFRVVEQRSVHGLDVDFNLSVNVRAE